MTVVALDIGGANLKASNGRDLTLSVPFPLWQNPNGLAAALREVLAQFHEVTTLAVTMTGELADCYPTRAAGVLQILAAVSQVAGEMPVMVWQTSGEFVSLEEAEWFPVLAAASNWHALATWGGRMAPHGRSLLLDIGSTTTDIIPIEDGLPVPQGRTDLQRLESGELEYLGVRRTPICALLSQVRVQGKAVRVAREFFATTLDAHLCLELIAENETNFETANGTAATKQGARQRLARVVCSDLDDLSEGDLLEMSQQIYQAELNLLKGALQQAVPPSTPPRSVLLTGEGEFLARELLEMVGWRAPEVEILSLAEAIGPSHSQGACAFALARLAAERKSE